MQLIRRIQIKYFRSVYSAALGRCGDLNVISGRNDAGKSNILRALNLFFNGHTDWQAPLDFYKDFSLQRLEQVRKESVKGKQFIQVEIEFERPGNYKGSLPPRFRVTRTWQREQPSFQESSNLVALEKLGKCPKTLETAQRFLPIFLNRIRFEYIPAVKDRAFFTHLLSRLQASLLGAPLDANNPVTPLAKRLAEHISGQVGELQDDFQRATGLRIVVEPPSEFGSLFQSFQVSTPSGESRIPLALRGDGLQARYIPSVLHYIAEKSSSFFIWGFEEPENSLEYSHADALAKDFESQYSQSVQIFVTTHSPAFVSRKSDSTSCFRVFQSDLRTEIAQLSQPLQSTKAGEQLIGEIGILQIQQEVHEQYKEKLEHLSAANTRVVELETELRAHSKPLLLVEGITDARIYETAWRKLRGDGLMPFVVRSVDPSANLGTGGAGGTGTLSQAIETIHPDDGRRVLAVFDHDVEGVRHFSRLSENFKPVAGVRHAKAHLNGLAFAITLAALGIREEYVSARNLSVEFLFGDDVLQLKSPLSKGLRLAAPSARAMTVEGKQLYLFGAEAKKIERILTGLPQCRKITGGKKVFAEEIVPKLRKESFLAFEEFFKIVEKLLDWE